MQGCSPVPRTFPGILGAGNLNSFLLFDYSLLFLYFEMVQPFQRSASHRDEHLIRDANDHFYLLLLGVSDCFCQEVPTRRDATAKHKLLLLIHGEWSKNKQR